MKSPQVFHRAPAEIHKRQPSQASDIENAPPELIKAAEGLESVFTAKMMEAMRKTVEPSEFSLHNQASDIYQGMLDQEYADTSAHMNSLGLARQIVDYMLRSQAKPQYTKSRDPQPSDQARSQVETGRTGGTHEGQSSE